MVNFVPVSREQKFPTADISHASCRSATTFRNVGVLARRHLFPEFGELYHAATCISPSLMHLFAYLVFFGRPFVKRFALCYRTVVLSVCLSCLTETLVYCGQMVGWIKMKLGMKVGLGSRHIVLDGNPAPSKKGTAPNFPPMSVVAKRLDGSRCHLVQR